MDASKRHAAAYSRAACAYASVLDHTLEPAAGQVARLTSAHTPMRILDLATGTGLVARAVAAQGASVVGVDVAEGMINRARELSPPKVGFLVADALALPFADASFDAVTCGFGLSHLLEVGRALAEVRRVLVAGGRLVASSWAPSGANPSFAAAVETLGRFVDGEPSALAGIIDEQDWADRERGAKLLQDAGLEPVTVTTLPLRGRYPSVDGALAWMLAWPSYGETAASLEPARLDAFTREASAAITGCGDLEWRFVVNYYIALSSARRAR
jgi:SAM-dependent methyltransferase